MHLTLGSVLFAVAALAGWFVQVKIWDAVVANDTARWRTGESNAGVPLPLGGFLLLVAMPVVVVLWALMGISVLAVAGYLAGVALGCLLLAVLSSGGRRIDQEVSAPSWEASPTRAFTWLPGFVLVLSFIFVAFYM